MLAVALALLAVPAAVRADRATDARLRQVLPGVEFVGTPLVDAVAFLRGATDLNLHVNWRALEQAGVGRDAPVRVRLKGVEAGKVLSTVLEDAAPGVLSYYVDGNVVRVTTRDIADVQMVTRVYPVGDLTVDVPDFAAPSMNLSSKSGNGGGGSGGGLFEQRDDADDDQPRTRAERAAALVDLVTTTVRPEIWQANGGEASIRYFNGSLVVTAPRSVQAAIGG